MSNTTVTLTFTGKVLTVPVTLQLYFRGGPISLQLTLQSPILITDIWNKISDALYDVSGLRLPDLTEGPWSAFLRIEKKTTVSPTLWITPTGPNGNYSAYLSLDFSDPIGIGGDWSVGPLTVTMQPNIEIQALYISYDKGKGGFDFKAKINVPTQPSDRKLLTAGSPAGNKNEIVSYPFPIPSQGSIPTFHLYYLGLGQRVGPTAVVTGDDPMNTIFDQLENQLIGDDPKEILTNLAKNFYQPDRNWFIAADIGFGGFRLKALFNDPAMYGLQLTAGPTTPLAGLLFEILYQKLGPNLGVYYGALTLPDALRRIVLNGVILILPGFSIWIYTNGDFKVSIGWPLGKISIGIQVGILTGIAGFYFAKLRSADNPGAQPSVNYNPILTFGIGISVFVQQGFNASIFSATISVTVTATFQGLLAWYAGTSSSGSDLAKTPDHYWFAGTAGLAVLIQGSVDFAILKASVTISLNANVAAAFETGFLTQIAVSASVSVEVSVKVIFFTIHLSFSTSISHTFYIGSGQTPASINGPLGAGLAIAGGPKSQLLAGPGGVLLSRESIHADALAAADRLIARTLISPADLPAFGAALRRLAISPPEVIPVHFVLQPTAVYTGSPAPVIELIASLLIESPAPQTSPTPQNTPFERLIRTIVTWLLTYSTPSKERCSQFEEIVKQLGDGLALGPAFGGTWEGFAIAFRAFIRSAVVFQVQGVSQQANASEMSVALLPMIDALALTYATEGGPRTIPFDTYNPTPPDYPSAVSAYYEELSWAGSSGVPAGITGMWQASGSPLATPSMAAWLFYDYFLMQCRNVAKALLEAAREYEKKPREEFLAKVESAHVAGIHDPWHFADLALEFRDQITGEDELSYLLDHFDYASAAGLGSRYMMQGLQLPDPWLIPNNPTPENMAGVHTDGLYVLTGQQFPVTPGVTTGTATLSWSPTSDAPPGWIEFDSSSPPESVSHLPLPKDVPPQPSPEWHGTNLLRSGSIKGEIDLNPLPPLTPHRLYFALKNQIAWDAPAGPQTILPFPQPLASLLKAEGGLQLGISTQPPEQQAANASPAAELPASGGLLIRLSLSQVPLMAAVNVGPAGSPSSAVHNGGSPGASGAVQYLPFVYQVNGTDEVTRDLIFQALQQDLSPAGISLLYTPPGGGKLRSEILGAEALLAKVNLSTLNQAPRVSAFFVPMMLKAETQEIDFAPVLTPKDFLRLIWELSVVNAPGFFLYYVTEHGQDLPAEIFSDAGVGGGQTAQFDILVELKQPAVDVVVSPWQNCVIISESSPATQKSLFAAVMESQVSPGAPVLEYSPTYPPGNVGFEVVWKQTLPSPEPPVPVDLLYQLIQFSVLAQGSYRSSVWSLPAGPTRNTAGGEPQQLSASNVWNYQQSVPVYRFVTGSPALVIPSGTPYVGLGQQVELGFRLIDIYGNPLPDVHQSSFTPLYNDPLISIAEWPGVAVSFYVQPGSTAAADLLIDALFDPDTVVLRGVQSPPLSPLQPSTKAQWEKIYSRYQLILYQMEDPNVGITVSTSLVQGTIGNSAAVRSQLQDFVRDILVQVASAIATSSPPDEWTAQTVSTSLHFPVPFTGVAAVSAIFPVNVVISLERDPKFVYPEAAQQLPRVLEASYSIPANLHMSMASPPGSPGGGTGVRIFAQLFEAAFRGFDGKSGVLKLAQRAGISAGPGEGEVDTFWAMRWSAENGISVELDFSESSPADSLVYFALRPLSTKLMSGPVQIAGSPGTTRNFSNVDIDAWAYQFLQAFDAFLAPELATAIAILDERYRTSPSYYRDLMSCKEKLSKIVPFGILPVFADQGELGDIQTAQKRLQQEMLVSLSSAFTVSTILQARAEVKVIGKAEVGSPPPPPPRLYGSVGPNVSNSPPAGSSPSALSQYTISPGELDLKTGEQWLTSLVTVAQPSEHAELQLPLAYELSYVQHDFKPPEMGYTPSSWLKFVLPGVPPLSMTISPCAQIPVPLIFFPDTPSLISQTATAANPVSPSGGSPQSIAEEIAEALEWNYTVELVHNWALQDELYFDVTFNQTMSDPKGFRAFAGSRRSVENLFAALANFQLEYPQLVPQISSIVKEAYPGSEGSSTSPGTAQEVIQQFLSLAQSVEETWPDYRLSSSLTRTPSPELIIEHYFIQIDSLDKGKMTLFGRSDSGGSPSQWPEVIVQGQVWNPNGSSASKWHDSTGQTWLEVTHTFSGVSNPSTFFRQITLVWVNLDIRLRQTAILSSWVKRNANLVADRPTRKEFIYQTETVQFADPVIPLIQRDQLQPLQPDVTLARTLEQIFSPLALVGQGLDSYMRVALNYEYQLAAAPVPGLGVLGSMPVLLADGIPMGSSSPVPAIAAEIAQETATWYKNVQPQTTGAVLTLNLALFGTVRGQQLPLVQINRIPIVVGQQPLTWWEG
ncbi:MAG TPA: hypothetical protein VGJ51_18535 [Candidatus Angelobacter sp.]